MHNPNVHSLPVIVLLYISLSTVSLAATIHVPGDYPTIQQAIDAAVDGDDIIIAAGSYPETIAVVGKSLALIGPDGAKATVIDAAGLDGPAVTISGTTSMVSLQGLTITNGSAAYGGGVDVVNVDSVTFIACHFTSNEATISGGAIRLANTDASIDDCSFDDNRAWIATGEDLSGGGAIHVEDSHVSIKQCHFENNVVDAANAPYGLGGAINCTAGASSLFLDECTFDNNRIEHGRGVGGAVAFFTTDHLQSASVSNCVFTNNAAEYGGPDAISFGGALSLSGQWTLSHNHFQGNRAIRGGAVSVAGTSNRPPSILTHCTFSDNAASFGGAMALYYSAVATIRHSVFTGNSATVALPYVDCGGAVVVDRSRADFLDCEFSENRSARGGALFVFAGLDSFDQATVNLTRCTFQNNRGVWGGALNYSNADGAIAHCTFAGNSATYMDGLGDASAGGGAARLIPRWPGIHLYKCEFTGNSGYAGGAIRGYTEDMRLCTFDANTSATSGGAILGGAFRIIHSSFTNNAAADAGGALWTNSTGSLVNCTFSHNISSEDGGAVTFINNDTTVSSTLFCENQPSDLTGPYIDMGQNEFACASPKALHVPGQFATIQQAIDAAGLVDEVLVAPGVYNEAISLVGKRVHLRSAAGPERTVINAEGWDASTVYALFAGKGSRISGFTITGGTGSGESGARRGGGVEVMQSVLELHDCIIVGNTAHLGGGLAATQSLIHISSSDIQNNHATLGAGGVYTSGSNGTIANSIIQNNSAESSGGGMLLLPAPHPAAPQNDVQVTDTQFVSNTAGEEGGGLWVRRVALHIASSQFRHNAAPVGGGLFNSPFSTEASPVTFASTLFCENSLDHLAGDVIDLGGNQFLEVCPDIPGACTGDLTGDSIVGTPDLLLILAAWGPCPRTSTCLSDLNDDGVVNVADLLELLSQWGPCQP